MRLIGFFLAGLLFAALGVQTITLRRANTRLETLEKKLAALADEQRLADLHGPHGDQDGVDLNEHGPSAANAAQIHAGLGALGAAAEQAGGLAGIAAAHDSALPLPVELSNPEAREQLATFVRAQIAKERQAEQSQRAQERMQRQTEANATLAQTLGLDPTTSAQFISVLTQAQQQRQDVIMNAAQQNLPRSEVREKIRDVSQKADEQIKALIGEEKFKQYQDTRRQDDPRGGFARGQNR